MIVRLKGGHPQQSFAADIRFNSMIVRLKDRTQELIPRQRRSFNSMIVRLKGGGSGFLEFRE